MSYAWLEDVGLLDQFHAAPLLLIGAERERIDFSMLATDEELQAIFGAGRDAMAFIAANLTAYEFFSGAQQRGFQVGIIYSPEEAMADPQFVARGFPTEVEHPEHGRSFTYPGAPYRFEKSKWDVSRRAPLLGEHNDEVLAELPRKEHA
jgi:benzylsuccinate CoA-transferase BbsE subunit